MSNNADGDSDDIVIDPDVYLTFCSPIDQGSVERIITKLNIATQRPGIKRVHLLFQSMGGSIGDGICLYNYFKTYPMELTVYNVGTIASSATIAYLGAKNRKAVMESTFMIHRVTLGAAPFGPATAERLKPAVASLEIDDLRMEAILKEHLRFEGNQWPDLRHNEYWFTAKDALKSGLATAMGGFPPPPGCQIFAC